MGGCTVEVLHIVVTRLGGLPSAMLILFPDFPASRSTLPLVLCCPPPLPTHTHIHPVTHLLNIWPTL